MLLPGNGGFEIMEGDSLAASGQVHLVDDEQSPFFYDKIRFPTSSRKQCDDQIIELTTKDVYKEFLLRGYEYGPKFQCIHQICNGGSNGFIRWTGNWVPFLDSLLQTTILTQHAETLKLPVRLRYLRIDPNRHLSSVLEEGMCSAKPFTPKDSIYYHPKSSEVAAIQ